MTIRETIAKLVDNGYVSECMVEWNSTVKPAAKHKQHKLEKFVSAHMDVGREYVKKDADGKPDVSSDPRSLPWGEWKSYPYLIEHHGREYLRLLPPEKSPETSMTVSYYVDGQPVSRDQFKAYLTPSDAKRMDEKGDCFSVTIDKLTTFKESERKS